MTIMEFIQENTKREIQEKIIAYKQLNQFAKKGEVVFAGSSLAEQFPIHELLQHLNKTVIIYNRGVSGDVIDGLLKNINTLILDLEPSKLFINIGSNDIGSMDYSEEALIRKYNQILAIINKKLPSTKIYILSYYPVNPDKDSHIPKEHRDMIFKSRTNQTITSANNQLKELAKTHKATYIDVSSCLMDEHQALESHYTKEGIHLWPIAYEKILKVLNQYL